MVKRDIIFQKDYWQGLKTDNLDYYLDLIRNSHEFKRRGDVEEDPSLQQIIPYIVFNFQDKYFIYRYLEKAGEQRLKNDYILGVAGHIELVDNGLGGNILETAMMREWNEEIDYKGNLIEKKLVGVLNDDSRPVEAVHLGLVYVFKGDRPDIFVKEKDVLDGKLVGPEELRRLVENTGGWASIVYRDYLAKLSK